MATSPSAETLFHLVAANEYAAAAIEQNKRFVSRSDPSGRLGLEIGFHVSPIARGHVIARLGRNADLTLRDTALNESPVSGVHVAFEIHPTTHQVLLSVRTKRLSSVTFETIEPPLDPSSSMMDIDQPKRATKEIIGDGVLFYDQDYKIGIAAYQFELRWRRLCREQGRDNADLLKALAMKGYQESSRKLRYLDTADLPTRDDTTGALSWHVTRLRTPSQSHSLFDDLGERSEKPVGSGGFGSVFTSIDKVRGNMVAIKIVTLGQPGDRTLAIESARGQFHREVKTLERLDHRHIIPFLGARLIDTLKPELLMPLRDGSLASLVRSEPSIDIERLCFSVARQILAALDYLAHDKLIHRDLKPKNILYTDLGNENYHFQLADFGLARHKSQATTFCGTLDYQAPELWPYTSGVHASQSPKMDVWSLFATIAAVGCRFQEFPPLANDYAHALGILRAKGRAGGPLEPMSQLHPDHRASAAQMLRFVFDGEGLTTSPKDIPPIMVRTDPDEAGASSGPGPGARAGVGPNQDRTAKRPEPKPTREDKGKGRAVETPLVVYPPPEHRAPRGIVREGREREKSRRHCDVRKPRILPWQQGNGMSGVPRMHAANVLPRRARMNDPGGHYIGDAPMPRDHVE